MKPVSLRKDHFYSSNMVVFHMSFICSFSAINTTTNPTTTNATTTNYFWYKTNVHRMQL